MEMNMLGWSSEAGNPNIQDLKEKLAKAEREAPRTLCGKPWNSNYTSNRKKYPGINSKR